MPDITAKLVKELRDKTSAGMMDCKKALIENKGDMEKSIEWLRQKGIASAEKKSGRVAGRPAHVYRFSSPEWVRKAQPTWLRISLALDDAYEAPLRVETFSSRSIAHKTFLLQSFKKINSTWIVKTFDCKNRADSSNTRFEVLSAALQLDLDPILFSPEGLGRKLMVPPEAFLSTK